MRHLLFHLTKTKIHVCLFQLWHSNLISQAIYDLVRAKMNPRIIHNFVKEKGQIKGKVSSQGRVYFWAVHHLHQFSSYKLKKIS